MKIAHIFSYFGDGGAEEHAFLLAKKAIESGNEALFIVSSSSDFALKRLIGAGFKVIKLPMNSSFNVLSVLVSAFRLGRIIRYEKIDVVHTHMLREQSLAIIAKIFGSKFLLVRAFHRFDQFNWKMRPLMPLYTSFTDAFIATSLPMVDYLKENGIINKVHTIENGAAKIATASHGNAIGFIGRLTEEKGILKFIEANINILKNTRLLIAGDGPDLEKIKTLIAKNDLKIKLLGKVSNKVDFYKEISALVLPSRTEVLPMVVLEAYSCGLPVAAFDLKLFNGLIDKSNGTLVEYPGYGLLGIAALDLLKKSKSYSETNIAKYEAKYSDSIMWARTFKLYRNLIG